MADFSTLISILTEHRELQKELYSLSLDKKNVLIMNDVQSIGDMTAKEAAFVQRLMNAEKRRAAESQALFAEHGNAERGVGLEALLSLANEREKAELISLRGEIVTLAKEQKALNAENRRLLETHIEFTESMINVCTQTAAPQSHFYSDSGTECDTPVSVAGILDREV